MLTNTEKQFTVLYAVIVLFELITASVESLQMVHYVAKPAIIISLLFFFVKASILLSKSLRSLVFAALAFSLLGDILLMFAAQSQHFFTAGLVAFLIAHIMYIVVFLKHWNKANSAVGFLVLLLAYALGLFYVLKDGLGEMLIPVIVYMIVILSMATAAFLRKNKVNRLGYNLVFVGALCFMLSDSILALNKFYEPIPLSNLSIMVTYAMAQYLIVLGILKTKVL